MSLSDGRSPADEFLMLAHYGWTVAADAIDVSYTFEVGDGQSRRLFAIGLIAESSAMGSSNLGMSTNGILSRGKVGRGT
jgi:hypothetical protein